jgi:hypothetical protein
MSEWWGFDLDATVAHYEEWGDGSIGAPRRAHDKAH